MQKEYRVIRKYRKSRIRFLPEAGVEIWLKTGFKIINDLKSIIHRLYMNLDFF